MNWALPTAAGLAALLVLAGGVWALRARRRLPPIETAEEAALAADAALAGFNAHGAALATDGMGALAVGRQGRVAVVLRDGPEGLAVREVPWTAVRSTPVGLIVETGDRRVGAVALAGIDALEVRRLTP